MTKLIRKKTISPFLLVALVVLGMAICIVAIITAPIRNKLLFFLHPALPSQANSCEVRGSWINDYTVARSDVDKVLDDLQRANLNTLFILAPTITNQNGTNLGHSNPTAFLNFVTKAKARGFSLHTWITNRTRDGSSQVNFTDPIEQQRQADWTVSLMDQYKDYLDGVHFDYIRYADWADVNSLGRMDGVTATVNKAHGALIAKYPDKVLTAAVFINTPNYANFTREGIPQWYRNWFTANPGNRYDVSSSSYDTVPEHMKYQQDPIGWVKNNYIEGIVPMEYTMTDSLWNDNASYWQKFLNYPNATLSKGFLGLGWLDPDSNHPDWGHDAAGIVNKIKYGRSLGFNGFVIFEFSGLNSTHTGYYDDTPLINALTVDSTVNNNAAPFKVAIASCLASGPNLTPAISPTPQITLNPTASPSPVPPINDVTPPVVNITSPVNQSLVASNKFTTIQASATDNNKVVKVEFFINSNLTCTDTTAPYTCLWRVPKQSGVLYQITAKAYDGSGNTAFNAISVTSK